MAKEELEVIKEADLTNNCPECFNQDMKITFYQRHKHGKFFHQTTDEISYQIKCNKCDSIIYPVNWTEDIERTFKYYQKMATPKRTTMRFTLLFYVLMLLLIVVVGAGVYFLMQGSPK
ncbi:hypothetical protein [Kriegella aquimaris]|uniref:Uncharacterized protein n=1 Tax=Kriegella aquimaris TaxID=192904 RepID=A0A1G9M5D3_9FLAO|nr:hypothetical protein [Kriegella aquimaris]SDL69479.1 hypothetical protein SAMN04488514_102367 [Kriegella aquimaris]